MTKKFRINLRAPHICLSTLSIMPIIAYLSMYLLNFLSYVVYLTMQKISRRVTSMNRSLVMCISYDCSIKHVPIKMESSSTCNYSKNWRGCRSDKTLSASKSFTIYIFAVQELACQHSFPAWFSYQMISTEQLSFA